MKPAWLPLKPLQVALTLLVPTLPQLSVWPAVLNYSDFAPQRTFDNTGRHIWLSKQGVAVGRFLSYSRDPGCCWISYNAQDSHPQQRLIQPKLSIVPGMRNPGLHQMTAHCHGMPAIACFLHWQIKSFWGWYNMSHSLHITGAYSVYFFFFSMIKLLPQITFFTFFSGKEY